MAIVGGLGSPELPDWAPTGFDVADYVPHRTLTRAESSVVESEDTYQLGFSETTRPTGQAVDRLLGKAVAWVQTQVRPMHTGSESAAAAVACMLCAAWVERGWPEDDYALQRANDLEKRADTLLTALIASNDSANADDDGDLETIDPPVAAYWSFPPADPRYDSAGYF